KDPLVRVGHGRLLVKQGKLDEAIAELQKDVKDVPDSPQAHYFLGAAYWQKSNTEQAKSEMAEALRLLPDLSIARDRLIKLHLQNGDPAVALQYAEEGVQRRPADESERLLLGSIYFRMGKIDKAKEQFLVAQQLTPADPKVPLALARTAAANRQWVQAEQEFERALRMNPHDTEALGQLVDFWAARNQVAKALARMQQYTTDQPQDAAGHLILGSVYLTVKNYGSAQAELQRAIAIDPALISAYLQLGRMYEAQRQVGNAIQMYQRALQVQPQFAPLHVLVGNLFLNQGRLAEARKSYEDAMAIDPNLGIAAGNLAWVYLEQGGDLDVALGLAQKGKQLMPQMPSISDTLGWVMYKKKMYSNALPLFEECVSQAPQSAQFHYHLGMTLLASGQSSKAKTELETALRLNLDPTSIADARQALENLN